MVFVAIALGCGCAHAADVFECKGPHGETIFQQEPCPKNAKPIAHGTYQRQPDAPPVYAAPPQAFGGTATGARVYTQAAPAPQVAGYRCTAGARTWVQVTPCPATYVHGIYVSGVDGTTTSGEHVTDASGWAQVQSPVQQQPLDRASMCAQMGNPGTHIQHSGHSDVYERNVGRDKYCH